MLPYIITYAAGLCAYSGLRLLDQSFLFCIIMACGATIAAARLVA